MLKPIAEELDIERLRAHMESVMRHHINVDNKIPNLKGGKDSEKRKGENKGE